MLTFDEGRHEYRWGETIVPSVTQIIAPLYSDTVSGIPPKVLEAKRILGTYVHKACELDDKGTLDEASLADQLCPYVEAWRKFKAEMKPEILANEKRMFHDALKYAGTVDRVVKIGRWTWIIDLKSSVSIYPQTGVQLAGYQALIDPRPTTNLLRAALQLKADGAYSLDRFADRGDWATFLGLMTGHNAMLSWRRRNG